MMTRFQIPAKAQGRLVSLMILTALPGLAAAQAGTGKAPPAVNPVLEQAVREEGQPGEAPVWKEDLRRVEDGLSGQTPPGLYMQALEATGLADHLRERALQSPDKYLDQWVRLGPVGGFGSPPRNGRIAGIQVLADGTAYRVYGGSCQGGLWKMHSTAFAQWTDIGGNLPNPSVRAFAVDPDDFHHIIVGTGDHGRYTGAGMFETNDEGNSWSQVALPFGGAVPGVFYRLEYLGADPGSGLPRLAAMCSLGPVWSDDHGATWNRGLDYFGAPLGGNWTDMVRHPTDETTLYAVCCDGTVLGDSGVYISQDYGEHWGRLTLTNLPASELWGRTSLAISRSDPSTMAVLVTGGNELRGVYRTVDGGSSWTDITGTLIVPGQDYSFGGDQIGHAQAIAIHPLAPDYIVVGAVTVAKSINGGSTWSIGEGLSGIMIGHADITQLHISEATGDDTMWICNDGGLYYHRFSNGMTYYALGDNQTGLACSEVDFLDAKHLVRGIGLQDNGNLLSFNAGQNWSFLTGGDGGVVEIFDPVDGDVFFNDGVYGGSPSWKTFRRYRATGVNTFTNNPDTYMPRIYYDQYTDRIFTHSGTGLYSMDPDAVVPVWNLLYSDWQTLPYGIRSIWSGHGRDDAFWITYWNDAPGSGEGDEDLTYVFNGPSGWDRKHFENFNPSQEPVLCVAPSNEWPDEAWVGVKNLPGSPKIYHLQDGGDTRINITGTLSSVAEVRAIAVMPFNPTTIYAGTDLGVFRTLDGGTTWNPFMEGLPIGRVSGLEFVEDHTHGGGHTLVVSLDGRGVWKRDIAMPDVIYVDARVAVSGDGSRWSPFKTVAEGKLAAPAGAIIAIHTDDYNEPQTIDQDVRLITWGGTTVIH